MHSLMASVLFISIAIFAFMADLSVGRLFMGGLMPGLLLATLFCIYIAIRCRFQPNLGPGLPPEEQVDWRGKLASLKALILPVLLVFMVLGSIFMGICSPTEAAAMGAFGSLICVAIRIRQRR